MASQNTNGVTDPLPVNIHDDGEQRKQAVTRLKQKLLPGARIVLIIWLIIYVCLLGIGIYGLDKCPLEKYIPIYLIATGAIGLVSKLLNCYKDKILPVLDITHILSCLYAVEIVLLIFGSYWVYKEYKPQYAPNEGKLYCNKTVYLFAFVYITIIYVVSATLLAGFLSFLVCLYFVATTQSNSDPEAPQEA